MGSPQRIGQPGCASFPPGLAFGHWGPAQGFPVLPFLRPRLFGPFHGFFFFTKFTGQVFWVSPGFPTIGLGPWGLVPHSPNFYWGWAHILERVFWGFFPTQRVHFLYKFRQNFLGKAFSFLGSHFPTHLGVFPTAKVFPPPGWAFPPIFGGPPNFWVPVFPTGNFFGTFRHSPHKGTPGFITFWGAHFSGPGGPPGHFPFTGGVFPFLGLGAPSFWDRTFFGVGGLTWGGPLFCWGDIFFPQNPPERKFFPFLHRGPGC